MSDILQQVTGWSQRPFDFSWETLRSFLDGVSPIDLDRLALSAREEAHQFLIQYGYDLAIPSEHHDAWQVVREAMEYFDEVLCPAPIVGDQSVVFPDELRKVENIAEFLTLASYPNPMQAWACALLRVMHTISHANHAIRSPYYRQIQRQILERYRQHVHEDENGRLFLGRGLLAVPLERMELREDKNRHSMILKLLHKPDNVAQSVYDRIGVKLVTPTKVDALLALRYIRRNHLAIFANIMPGRSRNTLVDLDKFREIYENIAGPGSPSTLNSQREHELAPHHNHNPNPHSSSAFRSIQFTCRQLIRIPNPAYSALARLREGLSDRVPEAELESYLEPLRLNRPEPVLRFFFPYEVQILDKENFERTQAGEASHENYRLRQLRTARRRVLAGLLTRFAEGEVNPPKAEPVDPGGADAGRANVYVDPD